MKSALVKIDVAADLTGKAIPALFDMADGAALIDGSLTWVFDLSNGDGGKTGTVRRDLRFWREELLAIGSKEILALTIDQVIARILPPRRENFHAGEVDQLFQIRHNTRLELLDSAGMNAGRNFYSRKALASFLASRWLFPARGARWPSRSDFAVQPPTRPLTQKTGAIAGTDKGPAPVASRLNRS